MLIAPDDPEVKQVASFATHMKEYDTLLKRLEYFSDWHRAKKAIAVCLCLQEKFRTPLSKEERLSETTAAVPKYRPVNVEDLKRAEFAILKEVQREAFDKEIDTLISMNLKDGVKDRKIARNRNIKSGGAMF